MTYIGDRTYIQTSNLHICHMYRFDAIGGIVECNDLNGLILLVINTTDDTVIYNPLISGLGGSQNNKVLQVDYDTSSMSDDDTLIVLFDYADEVDTNLILDEIKHQLQKLNEQMERILE